MTMNTTSRKGYVCTEHVNVWSSRMKHEAISRTHHFISIISVNLHSLYVSNNNGIHRAKTRDTSYSEQEYEYT